MRNIFFARSLPDNLIPKVIVKCVAIVLVMSVLQSIVMSYLLYMEYSILTSIRAANTVAALVTLVGCRQRGFSIIDAALIGLGTVFIFMGLLTLVVLEDLFQGSIQMIFGFLLMLRIYSAGPKDLLPLST